LREQTQADHSGDSDGGAASELSIGVGEVVALHARRFASEPFSTNRRPDDLSLNDWCGREDSNFHGLAATATSTLRVYQFRHDRTSGESRHARTAAVTGTAAPLAKGPEARNGASLATQFVPSRDMILRACLPKARA